MLKAMNDYVKYSADAESIRLLKQSMNISSEMAWLVSAPNQDILVRIDDLKPGDVIAVHKGEVIAVEGEIVDGSALVNTMYCTGQPIVSRLRAGNKVYQGMSLISESLKIKVEKVPEKVNKPLIGKEKMDIHEKVSSFQNFITHVSIGTSILSYLVRGDIMNALAIVLVLTPSGSGTALSTGLKSYITLLNKHKIFIKSPEAFEKVINTDRIVFDKTGTLTNEIMKLDFIKSFDSNFSEDQLLKICAACESDHYHPISISLQNQISSGLDTSKVKHSILIPSKGVQASYEQHTVLIGNKDFMEENGVDLKQGSEMYMSCEKKLLSPVLVGIDGKLSGIIALRDSLREGANELVNRLKERPNMNVSLLTGDNEYKAENIGQRLGINDIYSECSYEDKKQVIEKLQNNETVLMVGDGINDVAAMRTADVSVSFANSSCDMVKLNSDCIIFEDDMSRLVDMMSLSHKAYRSINQNITLSQLFNIVFGWLAIMGRIDAFTAKSLNTLNSLMVMLLNKRIEYLSPEGPYDYNKK